MPCSPKRPEAAGRRQLFVYWKVPSAQSPAAEAAVRSALAVLRQRHPQLQCRLWAREAEAGGAAGAAAQATTHTWMESYSSAELGIHPALQAQIDAAHHAWASDFGIQRHTEVFFLREDCDAD